LLDISKCFDSIYTHTISWAVKDKETAKNKTSHEYFGSAFDSFMQNINYRETNSICIGPEVSRLFAEIIFAKIDKNVTKTLVKKKIVNKKDYEIRRYIDNYYVFVNDIGEADEIQHELSIALQEYNLHINDGKTEDFVRPFYTKKSFAVDSINKHINNLMENIVNKETINGKVYLFPQKVFKQKAVVKSFINEAKAACFAADLQYDAVSNYVLGAIRNKLISIADNYDEAILLNVGQENIKVEYYRVVFEVLLELGFYFFSIHPTVSSSLALSHSIVRAGQYLEKIDEPGYQILQEKLLRWVHQLSSSPAFSQLLIRQTVIPIEFLNIIISLEAFGSDGRVEHKMLENLKSEDKNMTYFDIITSLFIFKSDSKFDNQRNEVFSHAKKILIEDKKFFLKSDKVHLLLDVLACPYIELQERATLLEEIWPTLKEHGSQLQKITRAKSRSLVKEIEGQFWFVKWGDIDLLNLIEKKELSAVY